MPSLGQFAGAMGAEGIMPWVAGMASPIAEFATTFVTSLKQLVAPFQQITDIASHFVQAIDPGLVDDLGRKFRDLQAVVGVAMRPIVDVAREVVKNLSDHMLPVMKKLEPIVREISRAVGDVLIQAVRDTANFLTKMMPIFDKLKVVVVGLLRIGQDLFEVGLLVVGVVADALMTAFGKLFSSSGNVADSMAGLRDHVRIVIGQLMLFVARLMMSFGWVKGVEALIKGMTPVKPEKTDTTGMAVAVNSAFKSISDLGKSVQLEAFRASAYGSDKKDPAAQSADFLGKIKTQLEELLRTGDRKQSDIITTIHTLVNHTKDLYGVVVRIANATVGAVEGVAKLGNRARDSWAGEALMGARQRVREGHVKGSEAEQNSGVLNTFADGVSKRAGSALDAFNANTIMTREAVVKHR